MVLQNWITIRWNKKPHSYHTSLYSYDKRGTFENKVNQCSKWFKRYLCSFSMMNHSNMADRYCVVPFCKEIKNIHFSAREHNRRRRSGAEAHRLVFAVQLQQRIDPHLTAGSWQIWFGLTGSAVTTTCGYDGQLKQPFDDVADDEMVVKQLDGDDSVPRSNRFA